MKENKVQDLRYKVNLCKSSIKNLENNLSSLEENLQTINKAQKSFYLE